MNERERAWHALRRIERNRARADFAIEGALGDERERGFLRTAVLGALRNRTKLDFLIERFAKRNIESIDADVATLLRLALYEILEMSSPSYAVVNEATGIAARKFPKAKGFVNGVLRSATRTPIETLIPGDDSARSVSIRTGHPEWLVRRWISHFGRDRAVRIAEADQESSWPDLLVNTSRLSLDEAEQLARERGVPAERSRLGIPVLKLRASTGALSEEIKKGLFHPMDEGSALVAFLVREGGTVADLAAAPGGKTLALMLRGAEVFASDASLARLGVLRRTARRFLDTQPRLLVADAMKPPFRRRFDAVLLDAPCSATGTLRKNPEARWRTSEQDLSRYAATQLEMLRAAGRIAAAEIVYSTCSLEPEENRQVVNRFLEESGEFEEGAMVERVPEMLRESVEGGELSLTPDYGTDGFTITILVRKT